MQYLLFLDESGDHGLNNIDPQYPVFVLCGIILPETSYQLLQSEVANIKQKFWGNKKVIFHSRDIRKCENEFTILFDNEIKGNFYKAVNNIISKSDYTIITSAIQKENYIKRYGRLSDDVYEIALSFVLERAIFYLDDIREEKKSLQIVIEQRGKKEDQKLSQHFNTLLARGTGYVNATRIWNYGINISFQKKKDDIVGLQVADLIAYPIARYVLDYERANPAFEIFQNKFYSKKGKRYGLKIFP